MFQQLRVSGLGCVSCAFYRKRGCEISFFFKLKRDIFKETRPKTRSRPRHRIPLYRRRILAASHPIFGCYGKIERLQIGRSRRPTMYTDLYRGFVVYFGILANREIGCIVCHAASAKNSGFCIK